MHRLVVVDLFGDGDDEALATLKCGREGGRCISLLLKDECRKESGDLGRLIVCERVFEDEFGEHELVCAVYLWVWS